MPAHALSPAESASPPPQGQFAPHPLLEATPPPSPGSTEAHSESAPFRQWSASVNGPVGKLRLREGGGGEGAAVHAGLGCEVVRYGGILTAGGLGDCIKSEDCPEWPLVKAYNYDLQRVATWASLVAIQPIPEFQCPATTRAERDFWRIGDPDSTTIPDLRKPSESGRFLLGLNLGPFRTAPFSRNYQLCRHGRAKSRTSLPRGCWMVARATTTAYQPSLSKSRLAWSSHGAMVADGTASRIAFSATM